MQFMQMLKSGLKPRRSFLATLVLVGVVASVMGLTPTKDGSALADSCANPPAVPTFNYWPVTYNDETTPLCHDFPAIDAAVDTTNPQFSQSEADWNDGLTLTDGQQAAALMYIHNGAANNLDPAQTTAKNVKIITETEQNVGPTHTIKVTYTADNAAPYTKSFTVKTPANSKLEVVPNSGFMYNYEGRIILDQQNLNLGNSTFSLGDLDACFEYSLFLTFKFKVVPQVPVDQNTTLSIDKKVKNLTVDSNTGRGAMYYDSVNAKQNEKVGYRIAVTNTGTSVARNVTVTDQGVAGVTVDAGSTTVGLADDISLPNGWSGSIPGTVNIGDLQPGESRLVKYTGRVTVQSGTLVNTAKAIATNAPQVQDNATVIVTHIPGNPNLTISKLVKNNNNNTAYAESVDAKTGEWVRFKVTITNNGNADLRDARIIDAIPGGLEFENTAVSDGTISFANNTITVAFNSPIPAGQSRNLEFNAQVTSGGPRTICNIASASATAVASVQDSACVNIAGPVGTPGLTISKLVKNNNNNTAYADSVTAKTGEWVRFQVTITNNGTAQLTGARITDAIPAGLEFENTASANDGVIAFSNGTLTVVYNGAIPAGHTRVLEFNAQVKATGPVNICNTAVATGNGVAQVQDNACVNVPFVGTPNLTIQKWVKNNNQNTAYADSVSAKTGEWVNFKITINNTGTAELTGARITDVIPAGLEFENSVVTDGIVAFSNNTLTVTFNSPIPAGQSKTVEFAAQVKATTTTTICNVAVATGNNVAQVQDNACVNVVGAPNLTITKQVKNGLLSSFQDSVDAKTNDTVTFKIVITNTGNGDLTGARITDAIPAGLQYADSVSTDGTATFANGTLTVVFNQALAAGQSKTVEFAAKVTATGNSTICNIAYGNGNSVNQVSADACVRVTGTPNLAIQKWVKTGGAYADSVDAKTGERVTFKISITNTGTADLTGARITDVIPTGLEYANAVVTDGSASFSNGTLTVLFNNALSSGQSKTVEFAAIVKATGPTTICNVAKANGNGVSEVQDDACVKVMAPPVVTNPKISIKKSVKNITTSGNYDDSSVDARTGERAGFKVTVTNTGDTTLNNVKVTDVIPTGLEYDANVSGDGSATFSGGTFTVNFGSMSAGQSKTVEFATKVLATGNTTICNVAKANADGVSQVQDDACVKIYTTPKPGDPNIVLSKKAFNDTKGVDATTVSAARGDYITYTLITTNNGNADKTNYVITDDLSQVLSLVDMVSLNGGTLSGNTLSFPAMTIKAGETVTKTFKVRIKQTLSAELTYQLKNTYGNTVIINVPGKTVYEAPKTGAAGTSAGIFAGLLTAGFVVARKRDSILKLIWN